MTHRVINPSYGFCCDNQIVLPAAGIASHWGSAPPEETLPFHGAWQGQGKPERDEGIPLVIDGIIEQRSSMVQFIVVINVVNHGCMWLVVLKSIVVSHIWDAMNN